jgi:hypothetical protein
VEVAGVEPASWRGRPQRLQEYPTFNSSPIGKSANHRRRSPQDVSPISCGASPKTVIAGGAKLLLLWLVYSARVSPALSTRYRSRSSLAGGSCPGFPLSQPVGLLLTLAESVAFKPSGSADHLSVARFHHLTVKERHSARQSRRPTGPRRGIQLRYSGLRITGHR